MSYRHTFLLLCTIVFLSCRYSLQTPASGISLFAAIPAVQTGVFFSNDLKPDSNLNILTYDYYYNGGGVAAADFNNDGLTDLYFTGNQVSSKLYLNKGGFTFKDITAKSGVATHNWATGVSVADVNNDGLPDIYVSYAGYDDPEKRRHQLFINLGNNVDNIPVFKEEAARYGLADTSYTTQSVFFDYDNDGDLDVLLCNHFRSRLNPNAPNNRRTNYIPQSKAKLLRNDNGFFVDVSSEAGFVEDGYTLGVTVSDINGDGWPDVYLSKDFIFDDALYINNKNGTFSESLKKYIQHTAQFSMGCDIADFNNDLYPDITTVDMLPDNNERQKLMNIAMTNDRFQMALSLGYTPQYSRNMLQLNNGPDANGEYSFSEIGQLAGVFRTDWSWSPLFADFDNDGRKDLFISNGIPKDITNNDFVTYRSNLMQQTAGFSGSTKMLLDKIEELNPVKKPDFIFKNEGNLHFTDSSLAWGLRQEEFSNGAVYVDLDNDGDLDLVTNNINSPARILKNNSEILYKKNHYLRIKLTGSLATGTKITVNCKGKKQFLEYYPVRGFESSQDPIVHFGLGNSSMIDTLIVLWPDNKVQRVTDIEANKLIVLDHKNAKAPDSLRLPVKKINKPIFTDITAASGINYLHTENSFEDVNFEPLIPHKFSRNGPFVAIADVDKNGYDDFWIGGSAKSSARLFLQQRGGAFVQKEMPNTGSENGGGVFFDANGDGYPDLYVVSGGNEFAPGSKNYQDWLFINDGKGNFVIDSTALPEEHYSGSCVKAFDFDNDGDVDLFVGGSVLAGSYPFPNPSMILQNDGKGKFTNVTKIVCSELEHLGLVTDALWSDFDNDGWTDLLVAGEWMPVTFFKNDHGQLHWWSMNPAVDHATGWWFSMAACDLDNDGDIDYVVGNLGLNNKFGVSDKTPLTVYAKDFDGNGATEPILTYYLHQKEYTVAGRDDIATVLPSIKKKFNDYQKFAEADFHQIFSKEQLQGALILNATQFSSIYLENKGGGHFVKHELPIEAQVSAIQTIQLADFDQDGNTDILIAGNFYSPDFMTGRYDASIGLLLKGDGQGNFYPVPARQSGVHFRGDVRAAGILQVKKEKLLIVAANAARLQVYRINTRIR